jgi:triacylglycerol lipase
MGSGLARLRFVWVGVVLAWSVSLAHAKCKVFLVPGAFGEGSGGSGYFITRAEYFGDYRQFLSERGCSVSMGEFPTDATIEERALLLRDQVTRFAGGDRVDLIAHSQGGLDARFAITSLRLNAVARLVTIGTPHRGTPLADWVKRQSDEGTYLYWMLRGLGGYDLRALRFATELTEKFLVKHQERFVDVPGVRYASVTAECASDCYFPLRVLARWAGVGRGDGMVPSASQAWGEDLGTFNLDHLSEVGTDQRKRLIRRQALEKIFQFLAISK